MIRKAIYIILILGILICLSPMLALLWAANFADRHGCDLHEGFVNPCVVNGADWGDTLYSATVSGWFMMFTLPVAILLVLVLILFAFGNLILRLFKK